MRRAHTAAAALLIGLAVRAAALLPLFLMPADFGRGASGCVGLILFAVLYVFAVIPLRCRNRECMRRAYYSRRHAPLGNRYLRWLCAGLARHLRGWLWGLPFLGGASYCVYYVAANYDNDALPVTAMWQPVQNFPTLLGMAPSLIGGIAMIGVILLLLLVLFAWGWRRDMTVEYLPVRSGRLGKVLRWARSMRDRHGKALAKCTLINFLLWLPGAAGLCAAAAAELPGGIDVSGPMALTGSLRSLMQDGISDRFLILTAAVFFLTYLPLCAYRKMRIAKTVAALMRDREEKAEAHRRAAG